MVVGMVVWVCELCRVCHAENSRVKVQNASVCTGKTPACVQHAGVLPVLTDAEPTRGEGLSLSLSFFCGSQP